MSTKLDMLELELLPILPYCEVIFKDDYFYKIGLKKGIYLKDLKNLKVLPENTKKKQLIKLFDELENNVTEVQHILSNNENVVYNKIYMY